MNNLNIREPQIGDRVYLTSGCMYPSDEGVVMGRRDTDWGPHWIVQIKDDMYANITINQYVGYAEARGGRGGYLVPLNHGGIGAYLVIEDRADPNCYYCEPGNACPDHHCGIR